MQLAQQAAVACVAPQPLVQGGSQPLDLQEEGAIYQLCLQAVQPPGGGRGGRAASNRLVTGGECS